MSNKKSKERDGNEMMVKSTSGHSEIIIESGVPIPQIRAKVKYPFHSLQPGESFVIPKKTSAASVTVAYWKKKLREQTPEIDFTLRAIDDSNSRVWRIDGVVKELV